MRDVTASKGAFRRSFRLSVFKIIKRKISFARKLMRASYKTIGPCFLTVRTSRNGCTTVIFTTDKPRRYVLLDFEMVIAIRDHPVATRSVPRN